MLPKIVRFGYGKICKEKDLILKSHSTMKIFNRHFVYLYCVLKKYYFNDKLYRINKLIIYFLKLLLTENI